MSVQENNAGRGRIAILGAGAIGQVYAGLLTSAGGGTVALVTRRKEAADRLRAQATIRRPDGSSLRPALDVRLADEAGIGEPFDLVIVAVSAYDTPVAAKLANQLLSPQGMCLTVQNGVGNYASLVQVLGEQRVALGATSFVVHLEAPDSVHIDGAGVTWVPELPARFGWLQEWLAAAGLNPKLVADPLELMWRKAAIATNGYVSLALAAPIGRVVKSASGRDLARLATLEIAGVARAAGVELSDEDVCKTLQAAWDSCSEDARSSLYSDYLAGRRTELDERLGLILQRAGELQVSVPVLQGLYLLSRARLEIDGRPV